MLYLLFITFLYRNIFFKKFKQTCPKADIDAKIPLINIDLREVNV